MRLIVRVTRSKQLNVVINNTLCGPMRSDRDFELKIFTPTVDCSTYRSSRDQAACVGLNNASDGSSRLSRVLMTFCVCCYCALIDVT